MGVCQRPHQAPRLVRDVEVGAHLEAVERLEDESQQAEDEHGGPSEPEMPPGQTVGRDVTHVAHSSDDPRTIRGIVCAAFVPAPVVAHRDFP